MAVITPLLVKAIAVSLFPKGEGLLRANLYLILKNRDFRHGFLLKVLLDFYKKLLGVKAPRS